MIEFFTLSWGVHIFIIFLLGICVLAQTLALVLNFFRYELTVTRILKSFLEVSILLEILVFSLLYGQVVNGYKNGFVVPTGYEKLRILVFLVVFILVIVISIRMKNLFVLIVVPAAFISLPIMERIMGTAFLWIFIGALIFFLSRSVKICRSNLIAIKTSISALSVIHAVDTLHTGVLFSDSDGNTLLSNYQMQRLMVAFTGETFRNSIQFYDILLSDKYESNYEKIELGGQIVYLLDDGTVWMFTKTIITLRRKNYIHISATDVSLLWTLTAKLNLQNQELRQKSDQLKKAIANLHILSKRKAIENSKMHAHDILGQRLSVLLRMIQNKSNLDHDLLISLSKGLLTELKTEQIEIEAYDELKSIQETFAAIGVHIEFEGKLPENIQQANLFVDIIREGSTNAVRHGLATRIMTKAELVENKYKLTIKNNGHTITNAITPGTGIKVMKRKVSAQGGNLNIIYHPQFTLSVILPGGEQYE